MKRFIALAVFLAAATVARAETDFMTEAPEQKAARMKWFTDARFGMFIHWGLYAVPAGDYNGKKIGSYGEWIMENAKIPASEYEKFVPQFNPVKFNARDWVSAARSAGAKYIVITSKHHDGFGLWRSEVAPGWCMSATPFSRDPIKELSVACKDAGVRFCLYHSIMDWHHPDWGTRRAWNDRATGAPDMNRYDEYLKAELKELLTGYGPIGILWFDGEWESPWTRDRGVNLYNFVRGLQPDIMVNNRVGKSRTAMSTMGKGQGVGDYGTPEQEIPPTGFGPGATWESCMTMNDTWGYKRDDHNWKSATTLLRNLIDCSSKGGNYLLNVGPTAEGLIPSESIERLQEIGAWMKVNGEAIYGTTASPFAKLDFGKCTTKGDRIYLHVFNVPSNRKLQLPGLQNKIARAWLLADTKAHALDTGNAAVTLPKDPPVPWDTHAMVVAVELDGPPVVK